MGYTAIEYFYSVYDTRDLSGDLPNNTNIGKLLVEDNLGKLFNWSRDKDTFIQRYLRANGYDEPFKIALVLGFLRFIHLEETGILGTIDQDRFTVIEDIPLAEYLDKHPEIDLFDSIFQKG